MTRQERIDALNYPYADKEKVWSSECNICGEADWTIVAHKDRYGFSSQSTFCRNCGFIATNPRMKEADFGEFYDNIYRPLVSAYHGRTISAQTIQPEQKIYADGMAKLLAPFVKSDGEKLKFLDVGGSTGVIAAVFTEAFGFDSVVIDPSPSEVENAHALGIRTVQGLIEDWDANGETFDVVGVFQTIDHLLDVNGTFKKMRELISEDGILIFDIVDAMFVAQRFENFVEALKIDHPSNFNEGTTEFLLARTGFEILQRSIGEDHTHITYLCRPVDPRPDAVPDRQSTEHVYRKIRRLHALKAK